MKPYLALIAALGLAACVNESTDTGSDPQPGQIQLVQGLSKSSSSSDSSANYVFDLDTIKSSVQDEFILQNTGDFDVKNIKLTTNNPHFYFSPSEISVLHPSKKSLLLQVIKLNVVHGVILDGVGYTDMLSKGLNTATAQITATTTNTKHDSINISQSANLKTFAKVADINLFQGSNLVDLSNPYGQSTVSAPVNGFVPWYELSGTIRVLNTGNTDLKLKNWSKGDSTVLKPDSTWSLAAPAVLEINTLGVISNPGKLIATGGRIVLKL